jgi:hypothetical protein
MNATATAAREQVPAEAASVIDVYAQRTAYTSLATLLASLAAILWVRGASLARQDPEKAAAAEAAETRGETAPAAAFFRESPAKAPSCYVDDDCATGTWCAAGICSPIPPR